LVLAFRNAEPDDWLDLVKLHENQQQMQGTSYELPYLFGRMFPVVIVGCDQDGVIKQCFYVESVAELRFIGCDPKATALSQRESAGLSYVLKALGFRWLETYVPRKLAAMIGKPLKRAGFTCADEELAHFTRDLRG
jgi:hypothetical protein